MEVCTVCSQMGNLISSKSTLVINKVLCKFGLFYTTASKNFFKSCDECQFLSCPTKQLRADSKTVASCSLNFSQSSDSFLFLFAFFPEQVLVLENSCSSCQGHATVEHDHNVWKSQADYILKI